VRLTEFPLLTDENLDPAVVQYLRDQNFDVLDIAEQRMFGKTDVEILRLAVSQGRVVVTHDSDFGTLAMSQGEKFIGVLYLRPGHIDSQFTIETLQSLLDATPEVQVPFIVVAKRSGPDVTIRVRLLDADP